jgi:N-formylglutamate deformylase
MSWLQLRRGEVPLIVSFPHTGVDLPETLAQRLVSAWRARKDTDWYVDRLYDFVHELGATTIRTSMSRTLIDVNRDVAGRSLYPGRPTTELCPTTTFDGEPLYQEGEAPTPDEITIRTKEFFQPYHDAIAQEIARLRARHPRIVLYDCHSIRSQIPRLFAGELPHFNIGTNAGASCGSRLVQAVRTACMQPPYSSVVDGRFKGGTITRTFGKPANNVHAIQMELACRGYLREPLGAVGEAQWPPPYDAHFASPVRAVLRRCIDACLDFASGNHPHGI